MNKFQIAIRKLGVHFSKPIWSFIRNCVFWLGHLNKIGEFRKIKADIKSLSIETLMERFVWVEDKAGDWTPWVMTIICQSFKDVLDGVCNCPYVAADDIPTEAELKTAIESVLGEVA